MKATTLFLITALALTACEGNSSSTADSTRASSDVVGFAGKSVRGPTAPPGMVGGVASQSSSGFSEARPMRRRAIHFRT
jgi:hypothetical protein